MPLFEISLTQKPTLIEAQAGGQEKHILPYTEVVAPSQDVAMLKLGAEIASNDDMEDAKTALKERGDNIVVRFRAS